jgi:hypothetical protein
MNTKNIPQSEQFQNEIENSRNTGKIDVCNIHIHDRSLSWLGTSTPLKCGGVKVVL